MQISEIFGNFTLAAPPEALFTQLGSSKLASEHQLPSNLKKRTVKVFA